jgi:hypothetical protein
MAMPPALAAMLMEAGLGAREDALCHVAPAAGDVVVMPGAR